MFYMMQDFTEHFPLHSCPVAFQQPLEITHFSRYPSQCTTVFSVFSNQELLQFKLYIKIQENAPWPNKRAAM